MATETPGTGLYGWLTVASKVVVRSGRHFAQFTLVARPAVMFGAIWPDTERSAGCDVEGGAWRFDVGGRTRSMCPATASTIQAAGTLRVATTTTGREGRAQSRATASVCCSTSIRAA